MLFEIELHPKSKISTKKVSINRKKKNGLNFFKYPNDQEAVSVKNREGEVWRVTSGE